MLGFYLSLFSRIFFMVNLQYFGILEFWFLLSSSAEVVLVYFNLVTLLYWFWIILHTLFVQFIINKLNDTKSTKKQIMKQRQYDGLCIFIDWTKLFISSTNKRFQRDPSKCFWSIRLFMSIYKKNPSKYRVFHSWTAEIRNPILAV